jgi:putative membrane protein
MRVEELFDSSAREAIAAAVRAAELRTSGEIVPMVVPRSHDYGALRATSAALLAFAAGIVVFALPVDARLWLPPVEVGVFLLGYWLVGRPTPLRLLLSEQVRAEAVDRAAKLAFLAEGLTQTRDRTGILIFVSLLEHRVEVLADTGIDEHVEEGTWDGVVRTILEGIRDQQAETGLVDAIRMCGDLLAAEFPPRADDTDELPNQLRT